MKIAVLGANGMLGYAATNLLKKRGHDVVAISRTEYDIATEPFSKLEDLLAGVQGVINAAGVIKPRIAAMPIEHTLRVNAIFPRNLAKFTQRKSIPCIHVTTDCVYTGNTGKYDEDALFDADDVYGMSKNAGENSECMVLRTSIVGEEAGQGRSLLAWAQSQAGKPAKGFLNHHWNGVTTTELSSICETILTSGPVAKGGLYEKGLFHVHSPEPVNKYELVSLMNEVYGLNMQIEPVQAPTACDRTMATKYPLSKKVCTKSLSTQMVEMKAFFDTIRKP